MEAYEYQTMFDFEGEYWWYRALHTFLHDQALRCAGNQTGKVLDAGAGTGQHLAGLKTKLTAQNFGFDYSAHAVPFLSQRGLENICRASVNAIPYAAGTFDLVFCIDIIECEGVDVRLSLENLCRVLKPGGHLIIVVPAFNFLTSPEHDRAVHADKRFTLLALNAFTSDLPLKPIRQTYLFAALFPAIALYRVWGRLFPRQSTHPRSELRPIPAWANQALFQLMQLELSLLRKIDMPFGSSIVCVYQKQEDNTSAHLPRPNRA